MVKMFRALESTGLRDFLGCPSVLYEKDLAQFFDTTLVKDNEVLCVIHGKVFVITEDRFAGVFGLPIEGLTDLLEVPKDLVFYARSLFSQSGEPVKTSCKKRKLKYEFRLLNDILAKSVTVKAGSFDAVTHERFVLMTAIHFGLKGVLCKEFIFSSVTVKAGSFDAVTHERFVLMTAIHFGLKVNWRKLLFDILKDMAEKSSKRAKGYADQICALLKGDPVATLGEVTTFPPLNILSAKTVEIAAPAVKKKRTTTGRTAPVEKDLALVTIAQDAVPIQIAEPISAVPAERTHAKKRKAPKRKLRLSTGSDDEIVEKEPDVESVVEQQKEQTIVDDVDNIIEQVLAETTKMETDVAEQDVAEGLAMRTELVELVVTRSEEDDDISGFKHSSQVIAMEGEQIEEVTKTDEESMSIEDLLQQIPTDAIMPSVIAIEPTRIKFGLGIQISGVKEVEEYKASLPQIAATDNRKEPLVVDTIQGHLAHEIFSLICADIDFLVQLREQPEVQVLPEVESNSSDGSTVYRSPSPRSELSISYQDTDPIVQTDTELFSTEPSVQIVPAVNIESDPTDTVRLSQQNSDIDLPSPSQSPSTDSSMHFNTEDIPLCADTAVEQILMPTTAASATDLTEKFAQLRASLSQLSIKQMRTQSSIGNLQNHLLSKIDDLEKASADAHQKAELSKEFDDRLAAIRNDVLEFRVETPEQLTTLRDTLAEIMAYITSGRDDKKGEVGSSQGRGQPPPEDRSKPGSGDGGSSGSRSEPSRKRGSSGSKQRDWRYKLS
ncbi:hypothetical protein F511_12696 [Dorcoceras hygrometricum]|uniref:Splicing factor 3B subunit 1-like n=1 Tax=Dorcoceras hygrometricum TaxID=472368 RepID=A0A2Z7D7H6_9LAMI|nr:hypothetical protein F511_12696 [Dorcoceras hygrometricum]